MNNHETINYLEIPAKDLAANQAFFTAVFRWSFREYGPDYCAFSGGGVDGGFYRADVSARTETGSVLVVFYSSRLEETQEKVTAAGGTIIKEIFSFPGGRRFHFADPSDNEYAVWSDVEG